MSHSYDEPDNTLLSTDVPGMGQVTIYRSRADGAVVVEIDSTDERCPTTDKAGVPKMRVYVNDDAVWENPPCPSEDTGPINTEGSSRGGLSLMALKWLSMNHDDEPRDQLADFDHGDFWAEIGPDARHQPDGWSFTIMKWREQEDGDNIEHASGFAESESAAKAAAEEWNARLAMPDA